jgi:hypothetical protein
MVAADLERPAQSAARSFHAVNGIAAALDVFDRQGNMMSYACHGGFTTPGARR